MKNVGNTRKVDTLGRIVLPKELRTVLDIDVGTPLEIYVSDDCLTKIPQRMNRLYAESV